MTTLITAVLRWRPLRVLAVATLSLVAAAALAQGEQRPALHRSIVRASLAGFGFEQSLIESENTAAAMPQRPINAPTASVNRLREAHIWQPTVLANCRPSWPGRGTVCNEETWAEIRLSLLARRTPMRRPPSPPNPVSRVFVQRSHDRLVDQWPCSCLREITDLVARNAKRVSLVGAPLRGQQPNSRPLG